MKEESVVHVVFDAFSILKNNFCTIRNDAVNEYFTDQCTLANVFGLQYGLFSANTDMSSTSICIVFINPTLCLTLH